MAWSLCSSPVAALCVAANEHRQYPCSVVTDDEEEDDVEFEFRPLLLPQPRGGHGIERSSRTGRRRVAGTAVTQQRARRTSNASAVSAKAEQEQPVQGPASAPQRRVVRWHHMAFGSVRVPSAMDMGEIRRRLKARQKQMDGGSAHGSSGAAAAEAEPWAPWRLIRSLSCKGVEAVAVAAVAAPVRLV